MDVKLCLPPAGQSMPTTSNPSAAIVAPDQDPQRLRRQTPPSSSQEHVSFERTHSDPMSLMRKSNQEHYMEVTLISILGRLLRLIVTRGIQLAYQILAIQT